MLNEYEKWIDIFSAVIFLELFMVCLASICLFEYMFEPLATGTLQASTGHRSFSTYWHLTGQYRPP